MGKYPPKLPDILSRVRLAAESGQFWYTYHTRVENPQRGRFISRLEITQVLRRGYHEASRDRYDEHYQQWSYAIRGKTVDDRELRIVVTFSNERMEIVSAYDLNESEA